jgi:hypothetical protein
VALLALALRVSRQDSVAHAYGTRSALSSTAAHASAHCGGVCVARSSFSTN